MEYNRFQQFSGRKTKIIDNSLESKVKCCQKFMSQSEYRITRKRFCLFLHFEFLKKQKICIYFVKL